MALPPFSDCCKGVEDQRSRHRFLRRLARVQASTVFGCIGTCLVLGCVAWVLRGSDQEEPHNGPSSAQAELLTSQALKFAAEHARRVPVFKPIVPVIPKPWWLCWDLVRLETSIAGSLTKVLEPPFQDSLHKYYERAATARLASDLGGSATGMRVTRMEVWPGPRSHGFTVLADVEHRASDSAVATVELRDDGFREPSTQLAEFWARKDPIVFVATAYGRGATLSRWLREISALSQQSLPQADVSVCLVGFEHDQPPFEAQLEAQPPLVRALLNRSIHTVLPAPFRKSAGLQKCLDMLPEGSIAFITDIDISFPRDIVHRVFRYVQRGVRALNPIVFYKCDHAGSEQCWEQGWGDGGPGIVALYTADARSFGGYDVERFGGFHGFEDSDFFLRLKYAGLELVRKREPGIIHHAHPKGPWRKAREKKFSSFEEYWNELSKQCRVYVTPHRDGVSLGPNGG